MGTLPSVSMNDKTVAEGSVTDSYPATTVRYLDQGHWGNRNLLGGLAPGVEQVL